MTNAKVTVDSNRLLDSMAGDMELVMEIITIFLADLPDMRVRLEAALAADNADDVAHAAHRLKGASSVFLVEEPVAAASALEDLGRSGSLDRLPAAASRLTRSIEELEHALRALLQS